MRTDLRFLLPRPPRTVALLGALRAEADAFALVGIEPVDGPADLVLAPAALAREALAGGHGAAALEGRGGSAALGPGARPHLHVDEQLVPLDSGAPLRYAMRHFAGRASRLKAARNRVAPLLLARGLVPSRRALALTPGEPYLLAAAREAGVAAQGHALWTLGSSDLLSRGALYVFAPGAAAPGALIKFGRLPAAVEAFDRDAAGLALAARAGGAAAAHAPRLLARFAAADLPAAAETAAPGRRLVSLLESADRAAVKRAAIDRIAGWITRVGAETAGGPPLAELERLRREVLPAYGAAADVLDGLDAVPAVLAHNDLGTWNLLVDGDGFTAVDWESARPAALPLWDLVYFLAYAVVALERVPPARRVQHLVDVFAGRAPASALVFGHIRNHVAALRLPPAAVGRLALTAWLHHGRSHVARGDAIRAAGSQPAESTLPRRLAERWQEENALGLEWDRWRA